MTDKLIRLAALVIMFRDATTAYQEHDADDEKDRRLFDAASAAYDKMTDLADEIERDLK